jgi:hypothetical protein
LALETEHYLREELAPRLGIDLPEATVERTWLAPDWVDVRRDPDRRRQVVQHLRDLGYLAAAETAPEETRLREALGEFYLEAGAFWRQFEVLVTGHTQEPPPPLLPDAPMRAALAEPLRISTSRLRLLEILTAFDGAVSLREMPVPGEASLRGRVLRFRLRTFNFLERGDEVVERSGGYDKEGKTGLDAFCALLSLGAEHPTAESLRESERAAVDLLGDAGALVDRFIALRGGQELLAEVDRSRVRLQARDFRRRRQRVRRPRTPKARLRALAEDPMNLFGLELLQVLLWIDGYYEGAIDLDWGPLSQAALEEAIARDDLERARLVRRETGFWRLDFRYGAERLLALTASARAEDVFAQQDAILEGLDRALAASPRIDRWEDLESQVAASEEAVAARTERRRYFGIGAFVRALRKVGDWVRHAFSRFVSWLHRLAGPVLQFVRFIGRGLRRALGYAALAVRRLALFLSGRPFVSARPAPAAAALITGPDLDGDTVNLFLGAVDAELAREHSARLQRMNRALGVVLGIAVSIVKALATGPLGWMWAVRTVFCLVRDGLEESRSEGFFGAMLWS